MSRHETQFACSEPYQSRVTALLADLAAAEPDVRLAHFSAAYATAINWPAAEVDYLATVDTFFRHAVRTGLAEQLGGDDALRDVMERTEGQLFLAKMAADREART